jgi:predicted nucleotidyltransferase
MIDKKNIANMLTANKSQLITKYHLKSIGIFGSFTREDFTDESDIGILIDYDQPLGIEFIDLAIELEKILNHKVDLVSKNGVKPKYFKEILKDIVYV